MSVLIALTPTVKGAIVSLNISGTIEQASLGDWDRVGKKYSLHITYDSEAAPVNETTEEVGYTIEVPAILILGGETFTLDTTPVTVIIPNSGPFSVNFTPQGFPGFDGFHLIDLRFESDEVFWDDPRSLPESLNEWRLDDTNFTFFYSVEKGLELAEATSSSYTSLSITSIPESSTAILNLLAIGVLGFHRSR